MVLHSCVLDKSSLSIGRVKWSLVADYGVILKEYHFLYQAIFYSAGIPEQAVPIVRWSDYTGGQIINECRFLKQI